MEEALQKAYDDQVKYLEEKMEIAERSRSYFGEEMYTKLMNIDQARNEALFFGEGEYII